MPKLVERKEFKWGPQLIKRFRGKRTQAAFGELLGVPKNTVWRWEAGRAKPDSEHARRLSNLAERERFLADWKLAGSLPPLGNLEEASQRLAKLIRDSLTRTAEQIAGGE